MPPMSNPFSSGLQHLADVHLSAADQPLHRRPRLHVAEQRPRHALLLRGGQLQRSDDRDDEGRLASLGCRVFH